MMSNTPNQTEFDAMMSGLIDSFIEGAEQRLDDVEETVASIVSSPEGLGEQATKFRNDIHSLKGTAGTFGFPLISILCHKLEDLTAGSDEHLAQQVDHIDYFLELMRGIINKRQNPGESETKAILAALPNRSAIKQASGDKALKVLLVSPTRSLRQLAAFLFEEQGCHVSEAADSLEGFAKAVETRPDIIVSSMEMKHISGSELGNALAAISALENTQFALLSASITGEASNKPEYELFPVLHVDQIGDDITKLLKDFSQTGSDDDDQ